ncbi:tRNA (guanosine(46)-N7)-methyltransferase TrmB [Radiobacillus sp. PE A8.2]|uniref:tRNA (guanosine(46)-N7)-methyltransferase TrmB n=1 Tax=Radiobacillus sp. PE A8.2 TaxID=3380349 RepID=UPI0038904706
MRVRHKPWADEFLEENSQIVIPSATQHKGNWRQLFGNDQPIFLEIGTGKGQFITGMAKQYPNINFIGIELNKNIIVDAVQKVVDSEQRNVRLINENAKDLREMFGDDEVNSIFLNFSDPWPKSRHEKRRLTFSSFLEQYEQVMTEQGEIVFKTDNKSLFEYSLVSFSQYGMELDEVVLDLHVLNDPTNVVTEYEEKFSLKGQPIYRCKTHFGRIKKSD